jgi:hypothetical protein
MLNLKLRTVPARIQFDAWGFSRTLTPTDLLKPCMTSGTRSNRRVCELSRIMLPPWMSAYSVFRLRSLMVSLVIVALILALVAQSKRALERETRLRKQFSQMKSEARAEAGMRSFLGDLGIVILKDTTRVELVKTGKVQVGQGYTYSITPTGKILGKDVADRISRIMLDPKHYRYMDADDFADPQVGVRLWRGKDSIDILFSPEGSSPSSPHQDVWVSTNPEHGEAFKRVEWSHCFWAADWESLIRELRAN